MPPQSLDVPFREKDAAKRLGARWDATRKIWFVPDGVDTTAFQKWLPHITIRSSSYFLAESTRECWKCQQVTPVFGFILPKGHDEFDEPFQAAAISIAYEPGFFERMICGR